VIRAAHALNWRIGMHLARIIGNLRRGSAFAVLGVALAAMAVGLSQCKMVDESLTGVSLEKAKPQNCMVECAKAYNDSVRVESDLHKSNVQACARDSVCLALEGMRHDAAMTRIQMGRDACQSDCHHQGGGGGH
jgi:hypothetical protein